MEVLISSPDVNIDGFICLGHVLVIIGLKPYKILVKRYKVPCVVTGFEPLDILQGILMLIKDVESGDNYCGHYSQTITLESDRGSK